MYWAARVWYWFIVEFKVYMLHSLILTISVILEKEIGFKLKLFLLMFNVQTLFFRPVEPLYKRLATFKLYVLPLSQFGKK